MTAALLNPETERWGGGISTSSPAHLHRLYSWWAGHDRKRGRGEGKQSEEIGVGKGEKQSDAYVGECSGSGAGDSPPKSLFLPLFHRCLDFLS
jgi:hypothetical protein